MTGATTTATGAGTGMGTKTIPAPRSRTAGLSELVVPGIVLAIAIYMTWGTVTMPVVGTTVPGPQFFPTLVCVLLYAVAIILAIQIIVRPTPPDVEDDARSADVSAELLTDLGDLDTRLHRIVEGRQPGLASRLPERLRRLHTDWRTAGMVVGGIVVAIATMPFAGWVLSAAFLFWIVSWALGSRRRIFDVAVAFIFASLVQLIFNGLLGLSLPSGFLEGVL